MSHIGIQLYTLHELAEKDLIQVLGQVAETGFDGVEFAGYFGFSAKKLRTTLDACGLRALGSHVGYETLATDVDATVDFSSEIGLKTLTCTGLPGDSNGGLEVWHSRAEKLDNLSGVYAERGLRLAYQNHDFEFRKFGDETALDVVMGGTNRDRLFLELDVFWAEQCGYPAAQIMAKYPGRCKFLHLTDMKRKGDPQNIELGLGILDFKALAKVAKASGVEWYILKQVNFERPPLESVRESLGYLRSIL